MHKLRCFVRSKQYITKLPVLGDLSSDWQIYAKFLTIFFLLLTFTLVNVLLCPVHPYYMAFALSLCSAFCFLFLSFSAGVKVCRASLHSNKGL